MIFNFEIMFKKILKTICLLAIWYFAPLHLIFKIANNTVEYIKIDAIFPNSPPQSLQIVKTILNLLGKTFL